MSSLRSRVAPLAVPLLAAAAVASCAAGTDAQTQQQRTTVNSVGGAKGTITVRNVYVVGPAAQGSSTAVAAALFNGGTEDDTLAGVSSPDASGADLPRDTVLAPGGADIFGPSGDGIRLTGLRRSLVVGRSTEVTLSFRKAGDLTLRVPVEPPAGGSATPEAAPPSPTATPRASRTPTATRSAASTPGPTPGGSAAPTR